MIQGRVERAQGLIALKCGLAVFRSIAGESPDLAVRIKQPSRRDYGTTTSAAGAAAGTSQSVGSDSGAHSWC